MKTGNFERIRATDKVAGKSLYGLPILSMVRKPHLEVQRELNFKEPTTRQVLYLLTPLFYSQLLSLRKYVIDTRSHLFYSLVFPRSSRV